MLAVGREIRRRPIVTPKLRRQILSGFPSARKIAVLFPVWRFSLPSLKVSTTGEKDPSLRVDPSLTLRTTEKGKGAFRCHPERRLPQGRINAKRFLCLSTPSVLRQGQGEGGRNQHEETPRRKTVGVTSLDPHLIPPSGQWGRELREFQDFAAGAPSDLLTLALHFRWRRWSRCLSPVR
jgi:hypothetical protein